MNLIHRAVRHEKFGSQKAVAEFLGITESQMSKLMKPYSQGGRNLQPAQAARLAEAMGENWLHEVLPILADLAPSDEDKAYWLGKAARLARIGGVSLALLLAVNVTVNIANVEHSAPQFITSQVIDYAEEVPLSDMRKISFSVEYGDPQTF